MYALPAWEIRQYDGTNAEALINWLTAPPRLFTGHIVSEEDGVLTLFTKCDTGAIEGNWEGETVVNTGDWILLDSSMVPVFPNSVVTERWVKVAE